MKVKNENRKSRSPERISMLRSYTYKYTEKNLPNFAQIWIYENHNTFVLLLLYTFKRFSYGHEYAKIAKSIYQIRSIVILKKHTTLFAKNARSPYSHGMAKLVWQFITIYCQTNLAPHSACEKLTARVLSRYVQVGLAMYWPRVALIYSGKKFFCDFFQRYPRV